MLHFDISFNNKRKWNAMSPFPAFADTMDIGPTSVWENRWLAVAPNFSSYLGIFGGETTRTYTMHIPETWWMHSHHSKASIHVRSTSTSNRLLVPLISCAGLRSTMARGKILLGVGVACKHFHFSRPISRSQASVRGSCQNVSPVS